MVAVADVNGALSESRSYEEALSGIARGAKRVLRADAAVMILPDGVELSEWSTNVFTGAASPCGPPDNDLLATVVGSGTPWIGALPSSSSRGAGPPDLPQCPSLLVPLTLRDHVVAEVFAARAAGAPPFDARDVAAVGLLVAQAGLALEARLTPAVRVYDALSMSMSMSRNGGFPSWSSNAHVARITRGPSLARALDELSGNTARLTDVPACAIQFVEPDQSTFVGGSCGLPDALVAAMESASRASGPAVALECALAEVEVVVLDEQQRLLDDPSYRAVRGVVEGQPWDSMRCLPVVSGDRRGALCVYFQSSTRPSESDLQCMRAIASQVAGVIATADSIAAGDETAVLGERHRLARELHDSVSQALYGVVLGARAALVELEVDLDRARRVIGFLLEEAEAGLHELSGVVSDLRREPLAREALGPALEEQVARLQGLQGLSIKADIGPVPSSAPEPRQVVYRIAQEALSNAVRHATAQHVILRLAVEGGEFALDVRDDGHGFDPAAGYPGHFGLQTMKERALALGGVLEISSVRGEGTLVHATIPMFPVDQSR